MRNFKALNTVMHWDDGLEYIKSSFTRELKLYLSGVNADINKCSSQIKSVYFNILILLFIFDNESGSLNKFL